MEINLNPMITFKQSLLHDDDFGCHDMMKKHIVATGKMRLENE